jgi:hypothetical protein
MMADAEGVSDNQYLLYIISQGLEKSIPVRRE